MPTRRTSPRLGVEAFCIEIAEGRERHALIADVSESGVRLTRPYAGGRTPEVVQLEIELPGLDEVIWAKGQVCFDQIRRDLGALVRTTGVRFAAAASRDLRLVRDYVFDLWRGDDEENVLVAASCYARG